MAENTFKVIETQEDFDSRIKERLNRAENKIRDEFKGWTSPDDLKALEEKHSSEIKSLKESFSKELEKYSGYDQKFADQENEIKSLRITNLKNRIVSEKNLPMSAVEFLSGESEEEISESADRLAKLSNTSHPVGFTRNTETPTGSKDEAYRKMLNDLTN